MDQKYNIFVTGCMRSGTSLMANLLNKGGISLTHLDKIEFSLLLILLDFTIVGLS